MKEFYTDINLNGGARIRGLTAAVATDEPTTLGQIQALYEGVSWKDSCRVASTANVTVSGPGTTLDGITMASGDRVLLKDQTTVTQNGIYIWNGAAVAMTRASDADTFAELEAAVVMIEEGTANAGTKWRQTQVNGVLGTNNIIWVADSTASPAASETTSGIAELATQSETDAGTDDLRIVTPLKLANYSGRKRKATATIGDGSATSFNLDHNFGTRDVTVEVYRNSGNYDSIICDVQRPTTNRVTLIFGSAPTANQYNVVVIG